MILLPRSVFMKRFQTDPDPKHCFFFITDLITLSYFYRVFYTPLAPRKRKLSVEQKGKQQQQQGGEDSDSGGELQIDMGEGKWKGIFFGPLFPAKKTASKFFESFT